jgi:hypothetical protein
MPLSSGLVDTSDEDVGTESSDDSDDDEPSTSTPLIHVGDLFLILSLGFKQGRVGFQLEEKVGEVDGKENDGGTSRKDQETSERAVGWVWCAILKELEEVLGIVQFGCVV